MKTNIFKSRSTVSVLALSMLAIGQAPLALAQTGSSAGQSSSTSSDIVVTGSRIGRTTFNSPTPVNVIGQQRAQDLNITSVGEALNQIPSFRPITSPATNSFRSGQNIAGRSLDLRGLGPQRTLTLVDGRRHIQSSDDGTFDLNSLPSILVQRSEVVTGGASAAYGADAVSGVVNLILDTKFTGFKVETSYGETKYKDGENRYGAFAYGHDFAGERGHFVVGGEFVKEEPVGNVDTRPWGRKHHNCITNPFFSTNPALSNGAPQNICSDNINATMTPWGSVTVVTSPFQGMWFDENGNLVPFQVGQYFNFKTGANPANMIGGDPRILTNYQAQGSPYVVRVKHNSLLGHADFDLTPKTILTAEVNWGQVKGGPTGSNARSDANGAIVIRRDNAYMTPAVQAMMDAAKVTTIPVSRINLEQGPNVYSSRNETWNTLLALKGELFGDWKWDAAYQWGQTANRQENANGRLEQRFKDSYDAVKAPVGYTGPTYDGGVICRTSIANPANGCIPSNVMGPNKISPAAGKWVNGQAWSTRTFREKTFAVNARGTLFEGWAGPISAAVGAEHRTDTAAGEADALSNAKLFSQAANIPMPLIEQKVTEGYVEFNVPIFKDMAFGKSLELDGAARRTHYSLSGDATTWKTGLVYQFNDEYMLRVTRSHDIRAPSFLEQNPNRNQIDVSLTDPGDASKGIPSSQYFVGTQTGGDPNVKLESADTFTAGVVLQPSWFSGLRVSFDYYDIKVKDAIDVPSQAIAMAICRSGTDPTICTIGVDRTGTPNRVTQLFTLYKNINELNSVGKEIVINYSKDLSEWSDKLSGDINATLNATIFNTINTTQPDGTKTEFVDYLGAVGGAASTNGVPRWRADGILTYSQPSWSVTSHVSYIPSGILNPLWTGPSQPGYSPYARGSVNDNTVSSRTYIDLSGRVKVWGQDKQKVELFGGVNNVADIDPPSQLQYTGNGLYYSPLGRNWKVGVRAAF